MDVADLLARAARCRDLAARSADEETRGALIEVAEEYEALVREMQAESNPRGLEPHSRATIEPAAANAEPALALTRGRWCSAGQALVRLLATILRP